MFFKDKLSIGIFSAIILVMVACGFFVFYQRGDFSKDNNEKSEVQLETQTQQEENSTAQELSDESYGQQQAEQASEEDDNAATDTETVTANEEDEKTNLLEITREDCENGCKNYKNKEEKTYCLQACNAKNENDDENCDSLSDLEKDYCLKNRAIEERDYKLCEDIEDSGIQRACKSRITEDIMDSQKE